MGGSSGGGSISRLGDVKGLEQRAKQALEGGRRNVFISFAYEDIDNVNLLRGQAKNDKLDLDFVDRSVREPFDSERAEYIRSRLTDHIRQASVTVVMLSEHTAKSDWVRWEVSKSLELGKSVIAIHPGDRTPALPKWARDKAIKVVPWSGLSDALKR